MARCDDVLQGQTLLLVNSAPGTFRVCWERVMAVLDLAM